MDCDRRENATAQWMVFALDAGRYAIPLAAADRIVRAAAVTPLPAAPGLVLGVLDVGGQVLPVFDTRVRFNLPPRHIEPADFFLIARAGVRRVVLLIDRPLGVIDQPAETLIETGLITHGMEAIRGVIRLEDGLVLIQDLEQLLSADESRDLDRALVSESYGVA
jgi:purine-binding chemotaxis protein CheW